MTDAPDAAAAPSDRDQIRDWWRTAIIDMSPGRIAFRGYPVEELIGNVSFPQMIWLMTRGALPSPGEAALLEAALVASVDHGPQAPSIAIARMAMTCGVGVNNAMASAINVLGDVHGGAGQGALELYGAIDAAAAAQGGLDAGLEAALDAALGPLLEARRFIPGFGHRFHPIDPRTPRLLSLADAAVEQGVAEGRFLRIARGVEDWLAARKGRRLPMNIDGITAAIYGELGFPPDLARGLFILSRSVGILAHAYEQKRESGRIKGPTPPGFGYGYVGEPRRPLPRGEDGDGDGDDE